MAASTPGGLARLSSGTFSGNTAEYGGGLYLLGNTAGQHSLVNSVFAANTAISGTGAAMYLFGSESYAGVITILHTTVASPTLGDGSAIFVGSSPSKVIPRPTLPTPLSPATLPGLPRRTRSA